MRHLVVLAVLAVAPFAVAETDTVLIVHTNDLHDHMRPDYDGAGGLTYVAGYIRSVRAQRPDAIVLDAGDVMEKGALVAYRSKSTLMYEAMNRIGYHAGAPGNHDDAYGLDHLSECAALAPDMALLCINIFNEDGSLRYPASKLFDIDGVTVGVIGMIKPRDTLSMDVVPSAHAIRAEAQRIEPEADLIVVTTHLGPKECTTISNIAPEIDVFVSGHTHQALFRPLQVEETGAYIVQAGSYAEYVGLLELEIDLNTEEIVSAEGELIEMVHGEVPNDEEMLAWIQAREAELAGEADEYVLTIDEPISFIDLGFIGAEAMRRMAGTDIGFCHASQIIRDRLPEGPVDVNAVFRTGGQRAAELYRVAISGEILDAYVVGLARSRMGQTNWSGFRAGKDPERGRRHLVTNLDPDRVYSVVISKKERDTRFVRFFEDDFRGDAAIREAALGLDYEELAFGFTEAVAEYLREEAAEGNDPAKLAESIAGASRLES